MLLVKLSIAVGLIWSAKASVLTQNNEIYHLLSSPFYEPLAGVAIHLSKVKHSLPRLDSRDNIHAMRLLRHNIEKQISPLMENVIVQLSRPVSFRSGGQDSDKMASLIATFNGLRRLLERTSSIAQQIKKAKSAESNIFYSREMGDLIHHLDRASNFAGGMHQLTLKSGVDLAPVVPDEKFVLEHFFPLGEERG